MKVLNKFITSALLAAGLALASTVTAQDGRPMDGPPRPDDSRDAGRNPNMRSNALRQLGLSVQQIRQIRALNAQRGPMMQSAQQRFREANRALDEAIYADQIDEALIQERLRGVQLAQAEILKFRFMNELAVRRILTPEQLTRFREMRQRFEQNRQRKANRAPDDSNMPQNDAGPMRRDQPRPVNNLIKQGPKKP